MLNRATYKKIMGMTCEEMLNFLTNYYYNIMEDASSPTLDLGTLRKEIGSINGVSKKRLDKIIVVIKKYLGI